MRVQFADCFVGRTVNAHRNFTMNFKIWSILAVFALVFVFTATATEDAKEKALLANVKAAWNTRNENFKRYGNRFGYNIGMRIQDERRTSEAEKALSAYVQSKKNVKPIVKPAPPLPAVHPAPHPAVKPAPLPSVHPVPHPAVKTTPIPEVHPAPLPAIHPVVEPAPHPVVKPAPHPVVEPAPIPAVEPAPLPAVEPAPLPAEELEKHAAVEPVENVE